MIMVQHIKHFTMSFNIMNWRIRYMGLLDLFKTNEYKRQINTLQTQLSNEHNTNLTLQDTIRNLNTQITQLQSMLAPEHNDALTLQNTIKNLQTAKDSLSADIRSLNTQYAQLEQSIAAKQEQLVTMDDEILLQEFGLYKPLYPFVNSEQFKQRLNDNRNQQKQLIKDKTAVNYSNDWLVNGSKAEGTKMNNNNIKQIIRTFNIECENVIDRVKFNNIDSMEKRINKSFESLNKMNESCRVSLTHQFLNLKIQELHLAYEYQVKKQEEKEEQKRIREEMREQARLQKELEDARKNIYKDQKHFMQAAEKIKLQLEDSSLSAEQKELLLEKQEELQNQLTTLETQLQDIDYRQNNQRAGYVYIISNIGAFGENVFKIGMTRRLEPMDRVDELGDASVPFNFDVHAMIFSEDAPALENALHKAFENKKLNMINQRREFFNVTLEEIEEVVKANFDKTVDFVKVAPAEQYRESLKLKQSNL